MAKYLIRAWDPDRDMHTLMLDGPPPSNEDQFREFVDTVWQECVRSGRRDVLWGVYDRLELPTAPGVEDSPDDRWEPRGYRPVYARKGPEAGAEHPILMSMDYRHNPPHITMVPVSAN